MLQPVAENSQHVHFDDDVPGVSMEDEVEDAIDKDRWDEGGRSDCGYTDIVHDTLMSLGAWVHGIVGEPTDEMKEPMKGVGSFFQEASYAVRDYSRGTIEKDAFNFQTDDLELELDNIGAEEDILADYDEPSDDEDII